MFQGKRFASRQSINLLAYCSSSITTCRELWLDINDHAASNFECIHPFCLYIPHRVVSSASHYL